VARAETLEVLADIARDAGLSAIADASLATAERLRAGLFYVVCVGQFKRGKCSTRWSGYRCYPLAWFPSHRQSPLSVMVSD
jgi:hypothetical protein